MTLFLCPSAKRDPKEPEPFLELEEDAKEALASSESASPKGTAGERTGEGSRGGTHTPTATGPGLSQTDPKPSTWR